MHRMIKKWLILICFVCFSSAYAAGDQQLQKIENLLAAGHTQEAYQLAEQMLPQYEGTSIRYDFLYGLSASRAGHPQQASFAFERVLMKQPRNPRVKVEYALTQYMLGSYAQAKQELDAVLRMNPPANVRHSIERLLSAIKAKQEQSGKKKYLTLFSRLGTGFDSNANSAPGSQIVNLPLIGNILLNPASQSQKTIFLDMLGGVAAQIPVWGDKVSLFGVASANARRNEAAHVYDTNLYMGVVGGMVKWDKLKVIVPVMFQGLDLQRLRFRNVFGFAVQALYDITDRCKVGGFVERSQLIYPNTIGVAGQHFQDSNMTTGGGMWQHQFEILPVNISGKIYYGREVPRTSVGFSHIGRYLWGSEEQLKWTGSAEWQPYVDLKLERSRYGGIVPGYMQRRRDIELDVAVGAHVKLMKDLTFDPAYTLIRNRSNTSIYDFVRHVFMVSLSYNVGII